jgi:hypothetical protein
MRQPTRRGWKDLPHINQMNPRGAARGYRGGHNCAPAVVAMVTRGYGNLPGMSDASLIEHLGKGLVGADGTTPLGLARMLARAGVPHGGKALGCCYEDAEVRDQLHRGNTLIAQVRSFDPTTHTDSAHYVLIRGMTRDGNYVISDPLANRPYTVTPQQLKDAIKRAPPDGGMLIPIPKPGADATSAAPTSTGMAAAQPRSVDDAFDPMGDVLRAPDPNAFMCQGDAFNCTSSSLGMKSASPYGFSEDFGSDYDDRSRSSNRYGERATDAAMQQSEQRNLVTLDIVYNTTTNPAGVITLPVTPADMTAEAYASHLLQRKQAGDLAVENTLKLLESSTAEKDKQVLGLIKDAELKQPGIGRKSYTIAF